MPLALLYTRVSTERQEEEGTSLATQESACRAYCVEKGYEVVAVFTDVHTASEWRERPGLRALREHLSANPKVGYVVVAHSIDRVARQQSHLAVLIDLIEEAGARLELVTEAFEDSATGRFIRNAKAFAAEVEREKIIERVQRGMLRYMQSGKRVPGRVPAYGLRWTDDHKQGAEEDPATAAVVRRIFQLASEGASLLEVAHLLTDEGIPSPTALPVWQSSSVAFLLRNPLYKGVVVARRWHAGRRRGKWFQVERPTEEHIPLPDWPVDPLVDAGTWEAAQRTLEHHKLTRRVSSAPDAFLLRGGYIVCGACGHALSVQRGRRWDYYRCQVPQNDPGRCSEPVYVRSAEVDDAVWEGNADWPGVVAYAELALRRLEGHKTKTSTPPDLTERRLRKVRAEAAALRRALARTEDATVTDGILADLTTLAHQERELRGRARALQPQPEPTLPDPPTLRRLLREATTHGRKRLLLSLLRIQVTVQRHPSRVRGRAPSYTIEALIPTA